LSFGQEGVFVLERILGRNHKPEFICLRKLGYIIGNGQMTDVNGIKRAEKESRAHAVWENYASLKEI
jgi:hypothetical protein